MEERYLVHIYKMLVYIGNLNNMLRRLYYSEFSRIMTKNWLKWLWRLRSSMVFFLQARAPGRLMVWFQPEPEGLRTRRTGVRVWRPKNQGADGISSSPGAEDRFPSSTARQLGREFSLPLSFYSVQALTDDVQPQWEEWSALLSL